MKFYTYSEINLTSYSLPLYQDRIKAGFPSPADDFLEMRLDLNTYLIKHPASTYFVRVDGDSMTDAGISNGDILIVDKSLEPQNNSIVIACINREFTVKYFMKQNNRIYLVPANIKYNSIRIENSDDFEIWGTVVSCVKVFK